MRIWPLVKTKEGWTMKNWCSQTVVLKKTLENPLDCKEVKRVNHKGSKPWVLIGGTDSAPILWARDAKSQLLGKSLMLGKIEGKRRRWRQRMRYHHWLNGHESEQTLGDGGGQRSLVYLTQLSNRTKTTTYHNQVEFIPEMQGCLSNHK